MSVLDPVEGIRENLAIKYLDMIFGDMGGSLPFTGVGSYPILGPVFETFNMIVLVAGIFLVIYHVVVGTLRTSNDGKMMGERETPTIRIIQMLSSIVLLIPTATGYCLAQILFMHVVVFGVYAADNVWKKTLDIFVEQSSSNHAYSLNTLSDSDPESNLMFDKEYRIQFRNNLQGIAEAIMCARGVWNSKEHNVINRISDPQNNNILRFEFGMPTDSTHDSTPPCGYLDVSSYTSAQNNALEKWINEFMTSGNNDNSRCIRDGYDCSPSSTKNFFIDIIKDSDDNIGYYPNHSAWLDDLINVFSKSTKSNLPKVNKSACGDKQACLIEIMGESGWILAGNYYRMVYELIETFYGENLVKPVRVEDYTAYANESDHVARATLYWQYFNIGDDAYWCKRYYSEDLANACAESSIMFNSYSRLRNATDQLSNETKRLGIKSALDISIVDFVNVLSVGAMGLYKVEDPFTKLVEYGYKLTHKGRNIITGITWANVSLTGVSVLARFGGPGTSMALGTVMQSMQSALSAVIPFAYAVAGLFYMMGGILSIYLPMIPFVIFLVAAIGWIISVIESMVAAPLVALGVIWPDAQPNVLGRAEPAVMMLLNLFLRPTFIIIGFLSSIALAYVGVSLLNIGFLNILEYGGVMLEDLLGPLIVQAFYVGLVYVIIKNCFTLITTVPDKVLMWIGDRSQGQPGADEALGGAKQQGDSGMSGGMQAVNSTSNAPVGVTQGMGDAVSKGKATWKKESNKQNGSGLEPG